jgi:heme A synthase
VTAATRYVTGLSSVTVLGGAMVTLAPSGIRTQVAWAAGVALVLQAPLGWWAVQSLGTERFLMIWGLGFMVRLAVVAIAGLAVVPLLGWSPGPTLGALVGVLVALLFVEGITAWREYTGEGDRR